MLVEGATVGTNQWRAPHGEAIILATVFADYGNGRTAPPLSRSKFISVVPPGNVRIRRTIRLFCVAVCHHVACLMSLHTYKTQL